MSTRLTVVKPSRCSRQVGRSALIWAYIDIIKYNYGVCRQVGRSTGQHQYVGRGATPSSGSGPVITRRLGGASPPTPCNRIDTPYRALIITLLDRHMPAYLSTSLIYHIETYWHGDVPVGGQVGRSAGRHLFKYMAMHINIYLYLDLSLCRPADLPTYRHWSEVNSIFW